MATAAAGPENGGAPRTELQELQLKSNQVTDEVSSYFFDVKRYHDNQRESQSIEVLSIFW